MWLPAYNPLSSPVDYRDMLNKLGTVTFLAVWLCVEVMCSVVPGFHSVEKRIAEGLTTGQFGVQAVRLVIALVIAMCFRALKLHNWISSVLSIRKNFDVKVILSDLLVGSGHTLTETTLNHLYARRIELMDTVFYKYASSTHPVIDAHKVVSALESWLWYWVCIESLVIVGVSTLILIIACSPIAIYGIVAIGLLIVGCWRQMQVNTSRAKAEVREILSDSARKSEVALALNAVYYQR